MGADGEGGRGLAPPTAPPSPLAERTFRRQTPKVGAECPNWARSDLCGGRSVMGVPTAIKLDETCGRLCWLSAERLAVFLVRASPRISWTRGTRSTPDCAMGR